MTQQNYAHVPCDCKAEQGRAVSRNDRHYCSEHCANSGTAGSRDCGCGHPGCR